MEPYKSEVEGTLVQFGQRRQQAVAAALQSDRRARRCDPDRRRLPDRAQRHRQQATRSRHPGDLVRQHRHRAERAEGERPTNSTSASLAPNGSPRSIDGKGNVIMVTGVAGTFDDTERNKGADSVWAKYPGIKVVNRYTGMWDSATAERNTSASCPSLPQDQRHMVPGRHRRRAQGLHHRQARPAAADGG